MSQAYFIGIDIGTQGARVLITDETGRQVGAKEEGFELTNDFREEQSPDNWWNCCCRLIPALVSEVKQDIDLGKIKALSVTSTSGTVIPIDHAFHALHPAIMYSDQRSVHEANLCRMVAEEAVTQGYTAFNTSSGLPKMRWWLNNFPQRTSELYKFIHAADFITGRLTGEYNVTDYTNAMKSGFNIHQYVWPDYISERLGINKQWLQQVRPSGEPLRVMKADLAEKWGLPLTITVTTGVTDGCASQIASGAVSPGQWNTTIGTTLVIKGVTKEEVIDPTGAIYNHRHPSGFWMPGGASNTGADWVKKLFKGEDLETLNELAGQRMPSESLAWPLLQKGERFPFTATHAEGFWPEGDTVEKFTACMEGVAFIERYAFERISFLSGEIITGIYSAGGGSNSNTWLRIRSSVINVPVYKMRTVSGAAGAAILAASGNFYSSLQDAADKMVIPEQTIHPDTRLVRLYEQKYHLFIRELKTRGILN